MNALPAPGHFPAQNIMTPRFREAGDITLDLLNRDGRVCDCWLSLSPPEFALLWRLAEQPGERISRYELEAESIAVYAARLRARLDPLGLTSIIVDHPDGGFFLDLPPIDGLMLHASPSPA